MNSSFLKRKWQKVNETLQKLWEQFVKEMIPTLHTNTVKGWNKAQRNIKEGDVVALLEEKSRGRWPLARVTRALPDVDGVVRFADVVIVHKEGLNKKHQLFNIKLRNRHVNKLMLLLPVDEKEVTMFNVLLQ